MFAAIFTYGLLFLIAILAFFEWGKYRIARKGRSELSYPRSRLIRRLAVAALIVIVLLMLRFNPFEGNPIPYLVWYGVGMAIMPLIGFLLLRDLHETSVAVVKEHGQIYTAAERQLEDQIADQIRRGTKNPKSD